MENYFNLTRYKELLELEKKGEISYLHSDLVSYEASISKQIAYNRKQDYLILIHEYLNQVITPDDFRSKFLQMGDDDTAEADLILKNFQELEVFTFGKDLEKFSGLNVAISILCLEFDEIWDGTIEPMSESEFYSLVNNCYVKFQEAIPIENFNTQAYEHLINQSFNGLIISIGLTILFILFNIYIIN